MTKLSCRRPAALGLALALLTGCGLLDTETPDIIEPGDIETAAGAQARRVGALSDWTFIRDGDGTEFVDGEILLTGLMADEFVLSTTPPGEQEIDQRKISTDQRRPRLAVSAAAPSPRGGGGRSRRPSAAPARS